MTKGTILLNKRLPKGVPFCPECERQNVKRLHSFDSVNGLLRHIGRAHEISTINFKRIRFLIKRYLQGQMKVDFISYCFERRYL